MNKKRNYEDFLILGENEIEHDNIVQYDKNTTAKSFTNSQNDYSFSSENSEFDAIKKVMHAKNQLNFHKFNDYIIVDSDEYQYKAYLLRDHLSDVCTLICDLNFNIIYDPIKDINSDLLYTYPLLYDVNQCMHVSVIPRRVLKS